MNKEEDQIKDHPEEHRHYEYEDEINLIDYLRVDKLSDAQGL